MGSPKSALWRGRNDQFTSTFYTAGMFKCNTLSGASAEKERLQARSDRIRRLEEMKQREIESHNARLRLIEALEHEYSVKNKYAALVTHSEK